MRKIRKAAAAAAALMIICAMSVYARVPGSAATAAPGGPGTQAACSDVVPEAAQDMGFVDAGTGSGSIQEGNITLAPALPDTAAVSADPAAAASLADAAAGTAAASADPAAAAGISADSAAAVAAGSALSASSASAAPASAGPGAMMGILQEGASEVDLKQIAVPAAAELLVTARIGEGTSCKVYVFEKKGGVWRELFSCPGVLGRSGLSASRHMGDGTTPLGLFEMNTPFGQKPALPGFPAEYIQVDEDYVWTDETNSLVRDASRTGEHVGTVRYAGYYNYVIDMGYNREAVPDKGAALFLHCNANGDPSTSGCVAIPEDRMIEVLRLYGSHGGGRCFIATGTADSWRPKQ